MQTSNVELPAQKRQISLVPGLTSPYATNAQKPSVLDKDLVPSRLKALWSEVEAGRLTTEEFCAHERELIRGYAEIWADALLLPGEHDLQRSVCVELGNLVGSDDLADIERKCRSALHDMRDQWNAEVKKGDVIETLNYYDKSSHYSYELMWWHSLVHDQSPLAYVVALHLALQNGFKDSLDFGSGVGSGGLLFSKHGFSISLGDVSSALLDFSQALAGTRSSRHLHRFENH